MPAIRSALCLSRQLWTAVPAMSLLVLLLASSGLAADKSEYNKTIRPILAENCFACHGPDSAARKADLRLDQRERAVEAGAITPGDPKMSELIRRILSDDPDEMMPPPASHKKLTERQKQILRDWITQGAEYQLHWSLIPPQRPTPPEVQTKAWIRNPIDNFILSKLEEQGLQPAPEADRSTLVRRLSLDLTGLPPSPEVVAEFVNDSSPDAYANLVDRLLNDEHWGEHRARYWLDSARYADTHGIHFDNYREMWAYRDWVIQAFNRNQPFDQFTIEQLAGDLLPKPTLDQRVATGFNRCNMTTNEGGVIPEEYLVLYTRDRTETVSQVWLGLTAGCAVCHDHKFDSLTQREFYEMAAFFNNTTQGAMDGNIKDTPPIIFVPRMQDRAKWDALQQQMAEVRQSIDSRKQAAKTDFDAWLTAANADTIRQFVPTEGLRLHAPLDEGNGRELHFTVNQQPREVTLGSGFNWAAGRRGKAFSLKDGDTLEIPDAGDFEADQGFTCGAWVRVPKRSISGAVFARMDNTNAHRGWDLWFEGDRLGMHIISKWPEDAIKVVAKTQLTVKDWYHVCVTYDGSKKASGIKIYFNGQPQAVEVRNDALQQTIRTSVPFKIGQRHTSDRLAALMLDDVQLFDRTLTPTEVAQLARAERLVELVAKPADKRSEQERNELFDWWLANYDQSSKELNARQNQLQQEEATLKATGTIAHVMQERNEPPTAYILFRGEYDKRRDQVSADTPDVLPPLPADVPRNRLGFAQWLLRPDHPLTARVTVNRFWQEVFGTGLVRTTGDFGVTGELPSHPELLDWLAVDFRESGWDVKRFFRQLVTSATYRQAAMATPEKLEKDPQNRLLSRGPRFRMDAEMIRDYGLAASGLLSPTIGGPSVKPYQPEGVWEAIAMNVSNTRSYQPDKGEGLYRRSLYTFWKRQAPPASMDIFNAPNREFCVVRRERTNTPLQALVTLNDPQFIEAARVLAERTLKTFASIDARLDELAVRLLARPWRPEERPVLLASLDQLLAYYGAHPNDAVKLIDVGESPFDPTLDPTQLSAWTMLVNQIMNLDEVLNK